MEDLEPALPSRPGDLKRHAHPGIRADEVSLRCFEKEAREHACLETDGDGGPAFRLGLELNDVLPIADCHLKINTVEILDYALAARPSHKALRLGIDTDDFAAEDAMGLFDPLFKVISRAEYLPDAVAETAFIRTNAAQAHDGRVE